MNFQMADKLAEEAMKCKQLFSESEIRVCTEKVLKQQSDSLRGIYFEFTNKLRY